MGFVTIATPNGVMVQTIDDVYARQHLVDYLVRLARRFGELSVVLWKRRIYVVFEGPSSALTCVACDKSCDVVAYGRPLPHDVVCLNCVVSALMEGRPVPRPEPPQHTDLIARIEGSARR